MEFRIKVYLYNFFVDYRKMCFLYVNKDMNTIQDLVNYISRNFEIAVDVYLTSDGLYLPGFEDIRILNKDDVVIVSPQWRQSMLNTTIPHQTSDIRKRLKRHKSPKQNQDENVEKLNHFYPNVMNEHVLNAQHEVVKKKRKALVSDADLTMIVDDDDGVDCTDQPETVKAHAKKKKRKSKSNTEPIQEVTNVTEQDSSFTNENVSKNKLTERITPALVREYTRKKKVDLLPISTIPKLVKPIIVFDNLPKEEVNGKESETSSDSDVTEENEKCSVSKIKDVSTDDVNLESTEPVSEATLQQKVKRKRKRTRRVRALVPKVTPTFATYTSPAFVTCPPRLHIRFDEVRKPVTGVDASTHEPPIQQADFCVTESGNGPGDSQEIIQVDKYKPKNFLVNYQELCEKEIVQFPIMKDVFPKVCDVIAFRRYKLSESYTPEISNYIIGRVCSYCMETSAVVVTVLEGRDECRDPHGKFCMEDERETESVNQEFLWNELIEQRLLFP